MPDSDSKIWLSPPHMGGSEQKYVQEAFRQNWIAPLGPNVDGFEQALEKYLGGDVHVAALSSGTAAIHLALLLLGVTKGDEVICQSFTFSASANPILYTGATPVFVDSEPDSWNMCPDYLEQAIQNRLHLGIKPKAIIAVHLYGMPYKHTEIKAISEKYDIPVIEDSAEALGSFYDGRPCGTLGNIGVLSFNGNKIITTSGGGALVAGTETLKKKAVFFATQAKDPAEHYEHSEVGYNYRLSNICAGIGCGQMEVLDERVSQKKAIHKAYREYFNEIAGVTVFSAYDKKAEPNHWLTCIVVNPEETGGKTAAMLREVLTGANIESRPLWKPMHLQPVFNKYPYFGSDISRRLFENGVCLPSGTGMTSLEKGRIFSCLSGFFE